MVKDIPTFTDEHIELRHRLTDAGKGEYMKTAF